MKNLFKNFNFDLILITYGINTGIFYSISTLLNQIISEYYPVINLWLLFLLIIYLKINIEKDENEKIGFIGLILVCSGLIGSIIGGVSSLILK